MDYGFFGRKEKEESPKWKWYEFFNQTTDGLRTILANKLTLKHLVGMTYGHLKGYCRSFVSQIHDNFCQTVVTIIL